MKTACMVSVIVPFSFSLDAVLSCARSLVPAMHDRRPGRFVRQLDFNHFRTIGMRRLVGEGFNNRFVTGERLGAILKVCGLLTDMFLARLTLFRRKRPI